MSLFSLDWFKSEKQKELEQLKIEGQKLKNEILRKKITPTVVQENNVMDTRMSLKLVNDLLILVRKDGRILTKQGATSEDFDNAILATTELELTQIFSTSEGISEKAKNEEEKDKNVKIHSNVQILVDSGDFEFKEGAVYMIGINRSMPELLIEQFSSLFQKYDGYGIDILIAEEYTSLKKFWLKCCLNPNAQSAEDLYTFLAHHQFKIDKHGNFYAYRRVVSRNDAIEKELVDFISNSYTKIKAVWKQKPNNFFVHKNHETYEFTISKSLYSEHNDLGNLEELYKSLPNMKENSYTDSQTGSYNYRVGQVISMPRHMGDDNNQVSCSKGFHQASKEYDYSGYGDTPILSIINPIDVLAVPLNEVGKLRVCRWFFATTLPEDEQYILDDEEFDVSELGDVFEEECMKNLVEHVQNSFAEEVQRHTFNIPQLSNGELHSIVNSLEEMKNVLSKRINVIE